MTDQPTTPDPNAPPISDGAPPQPPATPTSGSADPKTPEGGTPPETSPGDKPADPPAQKPEPTPEEVAAAARAAVPDTAEAYQVNLAAEDREALGLTDNDPLVEALAKFGAENKRSQGWLDDMLEGASILQKAGLFDAGFDPAAERASLGEGAEGRQRDIELFAESLKQRGEIDEGMYGELMSLSPTANGVKLIEYMRRQMGSSGAVPVLGGAEVDALSEAKAKASEMRRDPRYDRDRSYRAEADAAWRDAYSGSR